jgi:RNA polymerase sigma factor for flagellar operon FliA
MGLIDAIDKYNPEKCDNFKNYARIRIKGAMLDELRALDWVPRSVRQVATQMDRKRKRVEQQLGRTANSQEVANALGVDMDRYNTLRDRAKGQGIVSYEDIGTDQSDEQRSFLECIEDPDVVSPSDHTNRKEIMDALSQVIGSLPEREQIVISLYYLEELNLKEIGTILGVTESRISQIHTKAIRTLRQRMKSTFGIHTLPIAA